MAQFSNCEEGLTKLNDFLSTRSYLENFSPSKADVFYFHKIGSNIDSAKYPHVVRWHRHISSYDDKERESFPGETPVEVEEKEGAPAAEAEEETRAVQEDSDSSSESDFEIIPDSDSDDEPVNLDELAQAREDERKKREAKKLAEARSIVVFDVKKYDSETDLHMIEKEIRKIEIEGLKWGKGQMADVAYGIQKLQMSCVIFDYVSTDILEEKIMEIPGDLVQSVDIVSFNKF